MGKVYKSVADLIGNTPLLELTNIEKDLDLKARVLVKLEYFNPAGSVKDRIAKQIIEDAEAKELLKKGATIVEATSGNTGVGLSSIAAAKGYRALIVMPDSMSIERRKLMKAYGAEIVLTEGAKGMPGAIEKAQEIVAETEGAFLASQFENMSNPKVHYETTGPEIFEATDGKVDIFISGVGTGGTISGAGKYLKEKNPNIKIVALEPETSAVMSGQEKGPHKIQGIGAGFLAKTLDQGIYDEILKIEDSDAFDKARYIAKKEGVLVGISSGAALSAAITLAKKKENEGKTIVALLPDTGERYLSTSLFEA